MSLYTQVCKSCLYKYFQTTADCPLCGVDLRPNPFERIRFDRTVQTIVNKIFSDLIEKDIAKEAHFYRSRGMIQEGAWRVARIPFGWLAGYDRDAWADWNVAS